MNRTTLLLLLVAGAAFIVGRASVTPGMPLDAAVASGGLDLPTLPPWEPPERDLPMARHRPEPARARAVKAPDAVGSRASPKSVKSCLKLLPDADEGVGLYRWHRFLLEHQEELVAQSEWMLRTMALEPSRFSGVDRKHLESYVSRVVVLLPALVPPDRMVDLKSLAIRILETPTHLQPEPLRKTRDEIEDLLERDWAEPRE